MRVSLPPSFSCPCSFSVKGGSGQGVGRGNLTVQSLNLGTSLISLSTYTGQKMPAGLQIVKKNRTWFYFEIIHLFILHFFYFPVSDLWLERAGVPPSPHGCLLHQKYLIRLNLSTHSGVGEGYQQRQGVVLKETSGCLLISHSLG